jgi:hypothetical protein
MRNRKKEEKDKKMGILYSYIVKDVMDEMKLSIHPSVVSSILSSIQTEQIYFLKREKMYPFPPSSFHISNEAKKITLTSTPLPVNCKKKIKKKIKVHPFPVAQSIQYKPWPFSTVKSNCSKLPIVKKVTKSNKPYPFQQ